MSNPALILGFSAASLVLMSAQAQEPAQLRLGIIGLNTSHVTAFTSGSTIPPTRTTFRVAG